VKLTHVRLLVDDYGEAYAYYRDTLGLEPAYGDEDGPYGSFATGDATLSRPDWGIRVTYARDPAGNLLELYTQIPIEE